MLDPESRHALAKDVFYEAMRRWHERGYPGGFLNAVTEDENGDPVLIYSSTAQYGHFYCEFKPLGAIEWIIGHCERIVNEVAKEHKTKGGVIDDEWFYGGAYHEAIKGMAVIASHRLFIGMRTKLCEATQDNLEEAILLGEYAFRGYTKPFFEGVYTETREQVDCRAAIKDAAQKVYDRKREHLLGLLELISKPV